MKYDTTTNIYSLCVFGHRDMTFTEQNEIDLYNLFESCCLGSFSDEVGGIVYNDLYSSSLVLTCKNKVFETWNKEESTHE